MNTEEWPRMTCREIAREVLSWMRQEGLGRAWVLDRYEKEVVARLPDVRVGSLALAFRRGVLFEDRGERLAGEGRDIING